GRSQTAVLKLIISRPPLFYTHGGKGGTPCFFALSMPLICQKKAQAPDQDILILVAKIVLI
ncbi:hypothetical protein, partial [Hungatella sp. SL.1.14]|uniref:hypothetical protein n=1 Tax=Hungatella sp. SL.1.14 TaxID=2963703 RepID=UPI0021099CD6